MKGRSWMMTLVFYLRKLKFKILAIKILVILKVGNLGE